MIPLPVPENPKVLRLEGACGIDDGADGDGSVEFRVMSGSEVLWSSGVMRRGMAAKKFSIPVAENGIRHLYLMADRVDNNSYDHADWVDLAWKTAGSGQGMKGAVVNASQFGMVPGVRKDQGPALRAAVYHQAKSDALPSGRAAAAVVQNPDQRAPLPSVRLPGGS